MTVVAVDALGRAAIPVAFGSGDTVSAAFDAEGFEIAAIQVPAAFQGTTVKFQAAAKLDGAYQEIDDAAGSQVSVTVAAGKTSLLPAGSPLRLLRYLKLVVAAQNADVTVFLLR